MLQPGADGCFNRGRWMFQPLMFQPIAVYVSTGAVDASTGGGGQDN